jgi:hypothetical protein
MKKLMSYEKFKAIIEILLEFQQKKDRISDFFEKEIMEDSWCLITLGTPVEDALVSLLADEFDCWYSFKEKVEEFDWWRGPKYRGFENDIENWLYSINEEKAVTVDGKEIDISSIESLYDYLVSSYNEKHKFDKLQFLG